MEEQYFEVKGARQNNLKEIDVDIPKNKLVVFCGVSGSGKSSLVFDTIAAESQRLFNETYPVFIQSLIKGLPRPEVDSLRNLSASVLVDQEKMGLNSRSTVGTITDLSSRVRGLFYLQGYPKVANMNVLSFNDPQGMCSDCEGLGRRTILDLDSILNKELSLNDGAIQFPNFQVGSLFWKVYGESGLFNNDKPLKDFSEEEIQKLLHGSGEKVKTGSYNLAYEGLVDKINRLYLSKDLDTLRPHVQKALKESAKTGSCTSCEGTRLNQVARACKIDGKSIADCNQMPFEELWSWFTELSKKEDSPILKQIIVTLDNLNYLGLGHLTMNRPTGTLSGGEGQRIKLVRYLSSTLTNLLYVFDEPTSGVHAQGIPAIINLLYELRDKGNSVLVVSHDRSIIEAADQIIELGPKGGFLGGRIQFQGELDKLKRIQTTTSSFLNTEDTFKDQPRKPLDYLEIKNANLNNLKDLTVEIPLGVFTTITGVSGAGKSSLVHGCIPKKNNIIFLDQSEIKGSIRSNPATYTGLMNEIRDLFAKINKVKGNLFSFNSKGACHVCQGLGITTSDLIYIGEVSTPCDACNGERFSPEILEYKVEENSIADVLNMPISDAKSFFESHIKTNRILENMEMVGIGYIKLGQALNTLSGGERQRLKLAMDMDKESNIYILDEPSRGLHFEDIDRLLYIINNIVERGGSVITIEHNLKMISQSDWIIDLGPGAGDSGGQIVYQGIPSGICNQEDSMTGKSLKSQLSI